MLPRCPVTLPLKDVPWGHWVSLDRVDQTRTPITPVPVPKRGHTRLITVHLPREDPVVRRRRNVYTVTSDPTESHR